jgi:hypothetical protein
LCANRWRSIADEIQAIIKSRDSRDGPNKELLEAFVLLLRHSGLRIRDGITLKRADVIDGRLFLRSAKTGVPVRAVTT